MRWSGLDGLELALALAAATAVLALLYFLRRPRRSELVPALFLWDAVVPARSPRSAWVERLRRPLSLLLALAIAASLLIAIADPERARSPDRGVLIVLDRSASMAARDVQPSRLEQAKARARALIAQLGARDRAAIVELDRTALPVTPLTGERERLLRAVADVRQSDAAGQLDEAAALARDLLAGFARRELVLLSDGSLERVHEAERTLAESGISLRFQPIGHTRRNVAITSFRARRYPLDKRRQEAVVALRNHGADDEPLTLRVRAGDVVLAEQTLTLGAKQAIVRVLPPIPATAELLAAELELARGPDALASDDRAVAVVPARARNKVLLVADDDRYLEAALLLDDSLAVTELAPSAYRTAQGFDVAVFAGALPASDPQRPALYLGAAEGPGFFPLATRGATERPFFDTVHAHPLVRGLALSDVNIARAVRGAPRTGDVIVAASKDTPLLIEGERDGVPFIALTFDLRASDLPLRPAFPLLMLRAIDRLAGDEQDVAPAYVAGEPFSLRISSHAPATLIGPDGARRALAPSAGTTRVVCERAGSYRVEQAGEATRLLAVNLPAEETDLAPHLASQAVAIAADAPARALSDRPWPWLAALALALASFEWLAYHRRWTV